MKTFTDSGGIARDADAMRQRLREDGYLFLPALLAPTRVAALRREVVDVLAAAGWLDPSVDPIEAVPSKRASREGDDRFFEAYRPIQAIQALHELAHDDAIVGVVERVLGTEVLVHPRKVARLSLPNDASFTTPVHQDHRLVQGAVDTLTVWIPLGDCDGELGGLKILEASHREGLLGVVAAEGPGGLAVDDHEGDDRWSSTDFAAGDAVLFHSLTVHGGRPNLTQRLRLSVDFRYQAATDPITAESLAPHYGSRVGGWDDLTVGWTDRRSISHPSAVAIVEMRDPYDPDLTPEPSTILAPRR